MPQGQQRARKPRAGGRARKPPADLDEQIERILELGRSGDPKANRQLFELLYEVLRAMARKALGTQSQSHTLQPTALVHEIFLKFENKADPWESEAHLRAFAAKAMRNMLVDHARTKKRKRRSAKGSRVQLDTIALEYEERSYDVLALHEALERLAEIDARGAEIVELRFFGGFPLPVVAETLGIGLRTAERDWTVAKAWLHAALH